MKDRWKALGIAIPLTLAPLLLVADATSMGPTKGVEKTQKSNSDGRFEVWLQEGARYMQEHFYDGFITVLMDHCIGWKNNDGSITAIRSPGLYFKSTPQEIITIYAGIETPIKSFFRTDYVLSYYGISYNRTPDHMLGAKEISPTNFMHTSLKQYRSPYFQSFALVEQRGEQRMFVDTITNKPIMVKHTFSPQQVQKANADFNTLCRQISGGPLLAFQ